MTQLSDEYFVEVAQALGQQLAEHLGQRKFPELLKMEVLLNQMDSEACLEWAITLGAWHLLSLREKIGPLISSDQFAIYLKTYTQSFWQEHGSDIDSPEELISKMNSRLEKVSKIHTLVSLPNRDSSRNLLLYFILKYICQKTPKMSVLQLETTEEIGQRAAKSGKADVVPNDVFALFTYKEVMGARWKSAENILKGPPEGMRTSKGSQGCLLNLLFLTGLGLLLLVVVVGLIPA